MAQPETVVDYTAWEKGYMPPSEHVLIDQLSYRGAKVVLGSDWGDTAIWVVMRGKRPTKAVRKALREMLDLFLKEDDDQVAAESAKERPMTGIFSSLTPDQQRESLDYAGPDSSGTAPR